MKWPTSPVKSTSDDELVKTLSEELPVGVCIMQTGKFCYVNTTFPIAIGYTVGELVGRDSLDIVVPEDREMVKTNTIKMLKGELHSPYQFRVTCKDRSIAWVMGTVKSIQYQGRPAILGNYMEITERKRMEEAAQESEEKYRELADSITDVFFALDENLRYVYWNKASETLTGIRANRALGRSIQEVFPDKPWRRRAEEMYRQVLKTQQLQTFVTDYDTDDRHCILEINAYPSRGGVSVFVRDITDRTRTEQALSESEEKYRKIFEEALDAIFIGDVETGVLLDCNRAACQLIGSERSELIGKHQRILHPPGESEGEFSRTFIEHVRAKEGTVIETQVITATGQIKHVAIKANVIELRGKKLVQGIFRDVTERKQVQESLQKSEERYRVLAENAGEAILVVQDDVVKFINPRGVELAGYSGEELASRPFASFIYPDDIHMVVDRYLRRLRGEPVPETYDFRIIRKDGHIRWGELSAVPISWEDRPAVLCFMSDITERKQTEEALRQSEEKYRTILEQMEDAYFEVDLGGRLIFVNNSVCRDLGYSKEELIGKSYKVFTVEEDIESLFQVFNEVYRTGVPNKGFPWRTVRKDGSHGFAETSISLLRNQRRETTGFRGVGRDITERKLAEEKLRQSEENYRALFDSSVIGTIVLDAKTGKAVMANEAAAKIFGFSSPQEGIGQNPLDFIPSEDREIVQEVIRQDLFEQDVRRTAQFRAVSKSGREIWLSATAARIMHKGRLASLISFIDITEQKQQSERLVMTDRLASIGELAAGAAHELNNPLTSITGFSQLLMERELPDDIRADLKLINKEAQRAASVTSSLLTFARRHAPVREPSQLHDIIDDVVRLRAHEHKVNCIEVKKRLASDLPVIMVDYYQMQQVFLNIIINAGYSMTEAHGKGTLTITTSKQNGHVTVSFADDGPGIAPEDLSRIFDPFFTTKEAGKGTGLGLSICHGIVAAHDGQIYAKSQPGEGAIIFVELPINGSKDAEVIL